MAYWLLNNIKIIDLRWPWRSLTTSIRSAILATAGLLVWKSVGFGTIRYQKPAACSIGSVGVHTILPQYPVWEIGNYYPDSDPDATFYLPYLLPVTFFYIPVSYDLCRLPHLLHTICVLPVYVNLFFFLSDELIALYFRIFVNNKCITSIARLFPFFQRACRGTITVTCCVWSMKLLYSEPG